MSLKDKIFIFDLHNTLYDEVMEYGGAMGAAIEYLVDVTSVDRSVLMRQIAAAHGRLGSDWDERVWQELDLNDNHLQQVQEIRIQVSEKLTKKYAYHAVIEDMRTLKKEGSRVFVATEASANAAADAIRWLDLDGVIDGVYSWPCAHAYTQLEKTRQYIFPPHPSNPDIKLQKPHPYIVAAIVLDCMKHDGVTAKNVGLEDVFSISEDTALDVSELEKAVPKESVQGKLAIEALKSRLLVKDTRTQEYMSRVYFTGDSFFKDGYLARNAGVPFIYAAYGKVMEDREKFEQAKEVLYGVTGWEPFLLQFTQEASRIPSLSDVITPIFTCKEDLRCLFAEEF